MAQKKLARRQFLKNSALTLASLAWLPGLSGCKSGAPEVAFPNVNPRVRGANEDIRIAVVGFNGRGQDHLKGFAPLQGVRVVALCDVDKAVLDKEVKRFQDRNEPVTAYQDIRRLLDDKDIDAISVATPNHWHSLLAVWAIQAGKDVYVEKPVSHNLWEGRQVVNAARKYRRIVQTGTQCRSSTGLAEAVQWLRDGNLGKIKLARGLCYKRRDTIGKTTGPQPVPESVDYDLWTGPAPLEPLRRKRLHYDWHWVWPSGNGDLGNQGIHQLDIARWFLGEKGLSPRVLSLGGRLGYEDDGTTPNTLTVFHDYPAAPLIFEVRGLPKAAGATTMDALRGAQIGVIVECEHGVVVVPTYTHVDVFDNKNQKIKTFDGEENHFANFITAVRSGKISDLHADILEGHLSSGLAHMANISYRLGKPAAPAVLEEGVRDNQDLANTLGRMEEHLKANAVNLAALTLGETLNFDPKAERFTRNRAANELLAGTYRPPFVMPEHV
jgi:predicted dehydrogenase